MNATLLRRPPAGSVLAGLVVAYLVTGLLVPRLVGGGWNLYLAQPLVWLGLAWICLRAEPRPIVPSRGLLLAAVLAGLLQAACYGVAGLLFGFGYSPYARSLVALAGNGFYLGATILGLELARYRLLELARERSIPGGGIAVAVLLAAIALPFALWQQLVGGEANAFVFAGGSLVPAAGESAIASLLCLLGGPYAAVAYRGLIAASEWLSPVLPRLTWIETGCVSLLATAAISLALRERPLESRLPASTARGVPAWVVTACFVVATLIWLNTGLLGVQPAIISGISMEPTLRQGDIIVLRNVSPQALAPGHVIRFEEGGVPVVHRIRQVLRGSDGGLVFVTQGDNNAYPDAPVAAADVHGELVLRIPRIGLIPITVRGWLGG